MDETRNYEGSSEEAKQPNPRDAQGFKENPAPGELKTPPALEEGEDSGEWTRGGGSDPNEGEGAAQRKPARPEAPSTRPLDDDIRKRGVVARLRERYGEAREFVRREPSLDAESYGHLEWILGRQSNLEHAGAAFDTEVSELVVLWLQDLARELDDQAFSPGAPGSDGGAASAAGVRQAAAEGLRTATLDFADEFLGTHPGPVPEP